MPLFERVPCLPHRSIKPLRQSAVRLISQPEPRELDGEAAYPPVAGLADPLLANAAAAVVRGARQSRERIDFAPIPELPPAEELHHQRSSSCKASSSGHRRLSSSASEAPRSARACATAPRRRRVRLRGDRSAPPRRARARDPARAEQARARRQLRGSELPLCGFHFVHQPALPRAAAALFDRRHARAAALFVAHVLSRRLLTEHARCRDRHLQSSAHDCGALRDSRVPWRSRASAVGADC